MGLSKHLKTGNDDGERDVLSDQLSESLPELSNLAKKADDGFELQSVTVKRQEDGSWLCVVKVHRSKNDAQALITEDEQEFGAFVMFAGSSSFTNSLAKMELAIQTDDVKLIRDRFEAKPNGTVKKATEGFSSRRKR